MGAKEVMFATAVIKVAWIIATVFLIIYDHHYWAVATFIGALIGGYSWESTKTTTTKSESDNKG